MYLQWGAAVMKLRDPSVGTSQGLSLVPLFCHVNNLDLFDFLSKSYTLIIDSEFDFFFLASQYLFPPPPPPPSLPFP
jgi:hypothetical protein